MKLLKLDEASLRQALEEESGMDFAIVKADISSVSRDQLLVIRSNGVAAPFTILREHEDIYTLFHMYEGIPFPTEFEVVSLTNVMTIKQFLPTAPLATVAALPPGYVPSRGARQLLGSITLSHPTRFFRFTSSNTDSRLSAGALSSGTYLTTFNDQQFVNSGFGAVGRFALPMPMPASYVHDYTFPSQTVLDVGTVSPQFGQSGGGVEVRTTTGVFVSSNSTNQIDDC
jgi:hypothetical protein